MPDPDLIETACHNAVQAMHAEARRAISEQRTPESCLILAAALDALLAEGVSGSQLMDCSARLRLSAAPRRGT
jgi:hypothetical protein